MKKYQLLSGCILCFGMLIACFGCKQGEEKAVREYSTNFALKAQANQLDSLSEIYPFLEYADSVYINFDADSLKVESAGDGLYKVTFNSTSSMLVKYAEDGKMTITETTGIMAWPQESMSFANSIGGIKGEMNDSARLIVMNNLDAVKSALFNDYVHSRKNAIKVGNVKITHEAMYGMDEGRGYVNLINTTDKEIRGEEYVIDEKHYYCHMGYEGSSHYTQKGKDIPANGIVKHNFSYSGHGCIENINVIMKTPSVEEFLAGYTPKGDEWANYAKAHPEALRLNKEKLANGPYEITGKIGGKYAITMHLNQGMQEGEYYYNNQGKNNTLKLDIKSFNPRTGAIVIEETAPDGKKTGAFTGTLTQNSFKGTMSVNNGQAYDFDLNVNR